MDNISTVSKAGRVSGLMLGTLSPPLGEKPQDHFMQSKYHAESSGADAEAKHSLMAIFQQVVEGLSLEDKELLAAFVGIGHGRNETPSIEDVETIIGDVLEAAIETLSQDGEELPSELAQESSTSIAIMAITQEILVERQRLLSQDGDLERIVMPMHESFRGDMPMHESFRRELSGSRLTTTPIHQESTGERGLLSKEITEAATYYLKGIHQIATHYGDPSSYRSEAILGAGGMDATTPQLATILPMVSMLGETLHDFIQKGAEYFSKEIGASEKILNKSDMVLDSKMTMAVLTRAFETLEKEQRDNQKLEFSLKIHPKSMGEVNVVVNATREQINIAVQASPEAMDKIKNDIVYFSSQYDNMKWKLNDQDIEREGKGEGSGKESSQNESNEKTSESDFNKSNKIINLII